MARFCPKCGIGMTDEAAFCGQCGTRFEDYLLPELPSGGTSAGGIVLGDTGMLKGNLANAPASVGGIHIAVGGERGTHGTAQSPFREHCPICGKLIREDDDYYRCPKCTKNYICPDDYDRDYRACTECDGVLAQRVERAEARAQQAEEERTHFQSRVVELEGRLQEVQRQLEVAPEVMASLDKTLVNSIGMEFVLIPAGTFRMGSNDRDAYSSEKPVHTVRITQPFYLGKYQVTQGQWQAVMGNNPSYFKGDAQLPVETVSWEDVQEFIRQLNTTEGSTNRLPTEAEWEYAARAGTTTTYSFGDDAGQLGAYAWFDGNAGGTTHPVGQKQPNPWGLYDMHSNVDEWVQDWFGSYTAGAAVDPVGPPSGSIRMRRGGGWTAYARGCRSASRGGSQPGYHYPFLGFRLLREVQ